MKGLNMHAIQVSTAEAHNVIVIMKHFCIFTDAIRKIAESVKIPVIANGGSREIEKRSDILKFRESCGASSVMIARAAEWNVTIFRKEGKNMIVFKKPITNLLNFL